jgi:hypothetical protein
VERSFGWLLNARRNARDYERKPEHSDAHLTWAAITFLCTKGLATSCARCEADNLLSLALLPVSRQDAVL